MSGLKLRTVLAAFLYGLATLPFVQSFVHDFGKVSTQFLGLVPDRSQKPVHFRLCRFESRSSTSAVKAAFGPFDRGLPDKDRHSKTPLRNSTIVNSMAAASSSLTSTPSWMANFDSPSNQTDSNQVIEPPAFPSKTKRSGEDFMSAYDQQQIDEYWDLIMPKLDYLKSYRDNYSYRYTKNHGMQNSLNSPTTPIQQVYEALKAAYKAHRGQMRKSGDPFIVHPVQVAILLTNLKMDAETVMAGLLHDTVEDTDMTFDEVEHMFGPVVRSIVEGETKVSKLPKLANIPSYPTNNSEAFSSTSTGARSSRSSDTRNDSSSYADEQAENLRQMFVAMTEDYRIIIVKLADRLHNMRTLRHMKPEKQIKISRETLDIFAPLAHRMGIWQFKSELEDTAFQYLYPQEYKSVHRLLRQHQKKFQKALDQSQKLLYEHLKFDPTLQERASHVQVMGRTKEIYSLWHKMETKGTRRLDQIGDVVALRVIVTPKDTAMGGAQDGTDRGIWLCYHVLGLVQHLPGFQPVPTRVKDYISFPKPNGYQSLHTAIMYNGQLIEVQIRTYAMHQVAEYGMASHWAYTEAKKRKMAASNEDSPINGNMVDQDSDLFNTPWLSSIKEWQNDRISSRDFVDSVRRELLGKRVFVFLRNGKILNLASGATVIDAAFQIHTEVGLAMHGAEINGVAVPFSYELRNGDVVNILSGEGKPALDWMRYAKSRTSRSKLRSYFRTKQKESLREAGKILLEDYLYVHRDYLKSQTEVSEIPRHVHELEELLLGTQYETIDDLLIDVGNQGHDDRSVVHKVVSQLFHIPVSELMSLENEQDNGNGDVSRLTLKAFHRAETAINSKTKRQYSKSRLSSSTQSLKQAEYVDPDHLCQKCLPVRGDEVIGTRISRDKHLEDAIIVAHRCGCPLAELAKHSSENNVVISDHGSGMIDVKGDAVVPMQWSDIDPKCETPETFLAEVVVFAEDRKLLLADCSEVVSDNSEIVKTGSITSEEHATLVFLVKVESTNHLQTLMNRLRQIGQVMSVERRFGSELL